MKKALIFKILVSSVIFVLMSTLCSCGLLLGGLFDDGDDYYDDTTNYDNTTNYGDGSDAATVYTVTTTANDTDDYGMAGSYTMLKSKEYHVGDAVTLTATVNDGYNFEGWYIVEKTGSGYYEQTNMVLLSDKTDCNYTMQDKSVTIAAIFSSYTLTTLSSTNPGGAAGSFTRLNNKKVSDGETVELTATVNAGYNFEGWYIDDVCISRNLTYNYPMEKENVNIEVRYSCYTLSTLGLAKNADEKTESGFNAGTYTQYSNEKLSIGSTVTLTATVNDGYNFVGWFIDGNCVETDLEYTYTMGNSNVKIEAIYSYYTLTTTAWYGSSAYTDLSENAALYVAPVYKNQKVSVGTAITVKAKEIDGWVFSAWKTYNSGTISILSTNSEYTFDMPASNIFIFANYINK